MSQKSAMQPEVARKNPCRNAGLVVKPASFRQNDAERSDRFK
ncbi:hypothetical protein BACCAP_02821 [Pseudoflavonifractor capillosus ATCC 29799]|uniref:Uncharacterized protein n=1 Tax=Pseudoflavonifractor capillosus ATCC 29799 TaxID=411467 RepID=A6NX76_9FIRM|nr:hypothetical protein BACCAP_02821 [Pseudoflavonifractor capillosus ATCC 29799]